MSASQANLEDVMVAMDVVDTLRHRQELIQRELGSQARRVSLVARLREIYRAQGIEVTDAMLQAGVEALEQDRFTYRQPKNTLSVRLAKLYIHRKRWAKPVLMFGLFFLFVGIMELRDVYQERHALPNNIASLHEQVMNIAKEDKSILHANDLSDAAKQAISDGNIASAKRIEQQLKTLKNTLGLTYRLQVVSQAGQSSGVWRIPAVNSLAKNYYLVVEAVDSAAGAISLPIVSEEDGTTKRVKKFGLRVDKATFDRIARDKKDDGIIQNPMVGEKKRGFQTAQFSVKTTGATIHIW